MRFDIHVRRRDRRPATSAPAFLAAAAVALALAACTSGSTAVPTSPPASTGPGGAAAATTVTGWGAIKDAVPADFPLPPGTKPADLPGGPFSGAYTSTSSAPEALVVVQQGLKAAGYADATQSVATEAGSVTIDASGTGGCRIQVTVQPLGGLASITVLYGAACP